jgi:MOSC domain-containing protein YiiM
MVTLKSIAYKPEGTKSKLGFLRQVVNEATLVEGYGIEGDRKGGHPKRNLNVMDDLTLAELAGEGYPTGAGVLGENLVLSGLDLRQLPQDTHLRLGSEAIIALGKLREPCEQLTELDARMPESVVGRVGLMCRVIRSGRIKVGDTVAVLNEKITES